MVFNDPIKFFKIKKKIKKNNFVILAGMVSRVLSKIVAILNISCDI